MYQGGVRTSGVEAGESEAGEAGRAGAGDLKNLPRKEAWSATVPSLLSYMRPGQIDARNGNGKTPLMVACSVGSSGKQTSPNFLTFPELRTYLGFRKTIVFKETGIDVWYSFQDRALAMVERAKSGQRRGNKVVGDYVASRRLGT